MVQLKIGKPDLYIENKYYRFTNNLIFTKGVVLVKKLICNIFVLWGAYIAAIKYYGDYDFFLVLPEVFLLVLLISAVSGLKRKIQWVAQFFIGILLCVYFSQCIYYTQTGELITGLALDNLD